MPDGIFSSPTSGMTVFGLHGFGALGPIFPLVIASQPFEPCLKVESVRQKFVSQGFRLRRSAACTTLDPLRGSFTLYSGNPNHVRTTNVSSWIPFFSPSASGVRVARMMISAEWALREPQPLCDRPQSNSSPKLAQLRVGKRHQQRTSSSSRSESRSRCLTR